MKKQNSVLTAIVLILTIFAGVCYGEDTPASASAIKYAQDIIDIRGIERFEQMFKTGDYNYLFRTIGQGVNILHYAALTGDLNRVKELLEHGADINAKDFFGNSVLHYAALSGNLKLVQWLVEQGLDVNAKDENG